MQGNTRQSWILDSKAQDPEFLCQNVKDSRFNKLKRNSGIPDLDSLAWREPWASGKSVYRLFPFKDLERLLESIAKSSMGWVRNSKCLPLCWPVSLRMATTYTRDRRFNHSTCLTCLTCTPELTANASESVLSRKISDYSQTEKSWTSEIFLECYCVARKKPIRREKTKPKARTLITVCGFVACSRALIFAVIGHNTI